MDWTFNDRITVSVRGRRAIREKRKAQAERNDDKEQCRTCDGETCTCKPNDNLLEIAGAVSEYLANERREEQGQ